MTSIKIACALLILTFSTTATTQEKIKVKSKPILKKCEKEPNPDDCTSNKLLLSINEKIKYPEISKKTTFKEGLSWNILFLKTQI